jgi:hypothetical protein
MAPDNFIIPPPPDDIASARIGACFDRLTGKLIPAAFAVDPGKADASHILFSGGVGVLRVMANSGSHEAAQSSIFELDTKAEAGYEGVVVGVNTTLDFNMESSRARTASDENINVTCSYSFLGQKQTLRYGDPIELYNIMTESFQRAYDAVCKAEDAATYLQSYIAFTEHFGHGCVTTLYLTAGSAFRLSLKRTSDASSLAQKYGGSASLSGHYGGGHGGVSVATAWANEQKAASANATLEAEFDNIPTNAPTADWANNMFNTFSGMMLSDFLEKAKVIEPPAKAGSVAAPALPSGKPESKPLPEAKLDPKEEGVSSELQKEFMAKDGFTGSWDEYVAKQKELLDSMSPEAIVRETLPAKAES